MATSSMLRDYTQLNTVPAIVGIIFAVSAGVQFLDLTISIGLLGYDFPTAHATFVSLGVLVLAFASSDTKDWRFCDTWKQAIVAVAVLLMVSGEYVTAIVDLIANNQPLGGILAFAISMAAWAVLSR